MKARIKEGRAAHIIRHAQGVFFDKGYAHTTISDICKMADCSRTTLYSYFASKENLYLAVIEKAFKKFLGHFSELTQEEYTGFEQVLAYSKGFIQFSIQAPKYYETIHDFYGMLRNVDEAPLQTEIQSHIKDSPNFERVRDLALLPFKLLTQEIQKGQDGGSINQNYSAEGHMVNIWAYLKGITDISPNISYISTFSGKEIDISANVEDFLSKMLSV